MVGVPLALVVLALVALRLFLPLDKIKELATDRLGAQLGREVTVQDVGLSLRGGLGIELRRVAVADPVGSGDGLLLEADGLDLKLEIGPLFQRELRVHRLVVRAPRVLLWRLADGSDNFTFADTAAAAATGPSAAAEGSPQAVAVSVAVLEIKDGSLVYRDDAAGTGVRVVGLSLTADLDDAADGRYRSSGRLAADSLLVTAAEPVPPLVTELAYDATWDPAAARLELARGDFSINGFTGSLTGTATADGAAPRGRGRLEIHTVDLGEVLALLSDEQREPLADVTMAAEVALVADLEGDGDDLDYDVLATVTDLSVEHAAAPGSLTAATVQVRIRPQTLDLEVAGGALAGKPLRATATVVNFEEPRLTANVGGQLDLALAGPFLPPESGLELGGLGTFDLHIDGDPRDPESLVITGTVAVANGHLASPDLPEPIANLDADLVLEAEAVVVRRCGVRFPSGDLAMDGRLTHPRSLRPGATGGPTPHLEFKAQSGRCDVDKMFPAAAPAATGPGTAPASPARGPAPRMPDITAAGTFAADTLIYSRVAFTQVRGRAVYNDNTVVCDPVTAAVYTGNAAGRITVDLTDLDAPRYAGTFRADRIEADDFVSRFTSFGGAVFGKTELNGSFQAAGRDPARIRETLGMDATVLISEGRLVSRGFAATSLGELAAKAGADLDREQVLRNLTTAIRVKDGRVALDRLRTRLGNVGDLTLEGSYGFTGDLAYGGSLLLSEQTTSSLLAKSGLVGDLLGSHAPERLSLPLSLGGSLQAPRLAVDYTALTEELGREATEEAADKLKDLIRRKLGK